MLRAVLLIRINYNADPDPGLSKAPYLEMIPDPEGKK